MAEDDWICSNPCDGIKHSDAAEKADLSIRRFKRARNISSPRLRPDMLIPTCEMRAGTSSVLIFCDSSPRAARSRSDQSERNRVFFSSRPNRVHMRVPARRNDKSPCVSASRKKRSDRWRPLARLDPFAHRGTKGTAFRAGQALPFAENRDRIAVFHDAPLICPLHAEAGSAVERIKIVLTARMPV